jgi:sodium/bile acid cotransporter 7
MHTVISSHQSPSRLNASIVKKFLFRRWFLMALLAVLSGGIVFSAQLQPLTERPVLRQAIVMGVMFVMALSLKAESIWNTLQRPWASLLAVGISFGLLPLCTWGLSAGLDLNQDLRQGLLVAAVTPSTLASAAVWTRHAGGDGATAIMVTVITNMLCFLVSPAWLSVMLGATAQFAPLAMVTKLGLLVVVPIMAAQLLRLAGPVAPWTTRHEASLGAVAMVGVLSMVFLGAIQTGNRFHSGSIAALPTDVVVMLVAVAFIHVTMLCTGVTLARLLRLRRGEDIAVGFAGSQKTLMVGLEVCAQLGVSVLPMIAYHVSQLIVDTTIADRFRRRTNRE